MTIDEERLNQFLGHAVGDLGAAISATLMLVGDHLGLYRALAKEPLGAAELARAHRHQRTLHPRVAGQPGRRRLCRVRPRQTGTLLAQRRTGPVPGRSRRAGRPARRVFHRRSDLPRARAHQGQLPHRQGHGMGRAPPLPVPRHRALLPRRLQRAPAHRMAARARRRGGQAAQRRQGRRRRLRPRRQHDADGAARSRSPPSSATTTTTPSIDVGTRARRARPASTTRSSRSPTPPATRNATST